MNLKKFFRINYTKSWKFFNECRWHIVFALVIFALFFIIGFTFPIFFRGEIFEFIAKMTSIIEGKTTFQLMEIIFFNNLKASFLAMILGIGFGIFPLLAGVINGYLIGFVSREAVTRGGILVMWRLLPHGIFELPAIIFSMGIGLKLGFDLFKKDIKLKYNLLEGLRLFIFIIVPLLLIAGIIE